MRIARIIAPLAGILLAACGSAEKKTAETPKDQLLNTLSAAVAKGDILYGHQDDLCYGHAWKVEDWEADSLTRSDVKAVTGKYPAILGLELGGIEMGDKASLDSVDFNLIRKAAVTHAQRGGIVTMSWPGTRTAAAGSGGAPGCARSRSTRTCSGPHGPIS